MAKILVAGQAIVVTSAFKLDDLKLIKKYRPEALTLYKGEGKEKEPDFRVGITSGAGTIGTYGAEFGAATHDGEGLATMTMIIPDAVEDIRGYVSDTIGVPVLKLNKLEETLNAVLTEIATEKAAIDANIVVAQ